MILLGNEMHSPTPPEMSESQIAAYRQYLQINGVLREAMMTIIDAVNRRMKTNYILFTSNGTSIFLDIPEMVAALPDASTPKMRFGSCLLVKRNGGLPSVLMNRYIEAPAENGSYPLENWAAMGMIYFDLDDRRDIMVRMWNLMRAMAYDAGIDWGLPAEFGPALEGMPDEQRRLEDVETVIRRADVAYSRPRRFTGFDPAPRCGSHDGGRAGETGLLRIPGSADAGGGER